MSKSGFFLQMFPNVPKAKMISELTVKIISQGYTRADGTTQLYMQCIQNRLKCRIALGVYVPASLWDAKGQVVRGNTRALTDLNLIINQHKGLANDILVRARLSGRPITLEEFEKRFKNPAPLIDFLAYMDQAIEERRHLISDETYRNHKTGVSKLRQFRPQILFSDIDLKLIQDLKAWMVKTRGNSPNTIYSTLKRVKTYLKHAREIGQLNFAFDPAQIKLPPMAGNRSYLSLEEVAKLERYYGSEFCPEMHRQALQMFLFSCYTGLRYTDLATITRENVIEGKLVFVPHKTRLRNKLISLKLNKKALQFMNETGQLFDKVYTNQAGNRYLKEAARACGIKKQVSWHIARHTFATAFLTLGGDITVLQTFLGHAKITDTQIYGKIIDLKKDEQMGLFDKL
jgi:site-specific recombinase XerD